MKCFNLLPNGSGAEAIGTLLSRSIVDWAAGVEQFDDTTILVLSVEGAEPRVTATTVSDRAV
jgi:hypothetical protein